MGEVTVKVNINISEEDLAKAERIKSLLEEAKMLADSISENCGQWFSLA